MAPRRRRAVDLIVDVAEVKVESLVWVCGCERIWYQRRNQFKKRSRSGEKIVTGHTADATSTSSLFLLSLLSNTDTTMKFAASLLLTAV
jgi:hypothetical protein